jgi:hypothetical protein
VPRAYEEKGGYESQNEEKVPTKTKNEGKGVHKDQNKGKRPLKKFCAAKYSNSA